VGTRRHVIEGTQSTEGLSGISASVKAVPRRLIAFVGRLHIDMTADVLSDFLVEAGLKDVQCRKLSAPSGISFHMAAFRVSCPNQYKELFYNEQTWPAGAELRDWYVSTKPKSSGSNMDLKEAITGNGC
jgi:hypothetical protein